MRSPADWELLDRLFGGPAAAFRHRMGLARLDHRAFYARTGEAAEILRDKQRVLDSATAGLHLVESDAGRAAFAEFLDRLGLDPGSTQRQATLALEPDYILLAPPDWRVVWASVCFPTRWSLEGKAGQPLREIHAVVPALNAEIGRKIEVFFDRLAPGEGWSRANWGLSSNRERNQHPSLPYAPLTGGAPAGLISVRVESQHLLKLTETGAIAFGIRILDFPLADVAERPGLLAGLREQLRTMPAEVADYKAIPRECWRRL